VRVSPRVAGCRVCEGGDAALVYDGEVDEKRVYAACPFICLMGGNLNIGDSCFLSEEWGCYL
jgi:hypothetical protein